MILKFSVMQIFGILLLCSIVDAEVIRKGSFCIGTGHTKGCDNELTNLHCYEGKCQCPEALTMSSANLPTNLNTRWYEPLSKCFATRGSMCDLHPTKKRVDCHPGVKCIPDPDNPVAGTCSGSKFGALALLNIFLFLILYY